LLRVAMGDIGEAQWPNEIPNIPGLKLMNLS